MQEIKLPVQDAVVLDMDMVRVVREQMESMQKQFNHVDDRAPQRSAYLTGVHDVVKRAGSPYAYAFKTKEDLEACISAWGDDNHRAMIESGYNIGKQHTLEVIKTYPKLNGYNEYKCEVLYTLHDLVEKQVRRALLIFTAVVLVSTLVVGTIILHANNFF